MERNFFKLVSQEEQCNMEILFVCLFVCLSVWVLNPLLTEYLTGKFKTNSSVLAPMNNVTKSEH